MGGSKAKQLARPPKKQKPKAAVPDTADDFQEAADLQEAAGGKHRAGDILKSSRAFLRALELYDDGIHRHPTSFDLAYNKARLQLELSQHPLLVQRIGLPLIDWLQLTLQSHQYALRLNEENQDVLFNTAQVLTSLAEQLSEADRTPEAVRSLQEALELLSSCLSRQEMLMEQHQLDFPDTEDGGVPLEPASMSGSSSVTAGSDAEESEQTAVVESPVTANDLLDTVHASLSALTTLVPLSDVAGIRALGDMAHSLSEKKAASYIALLPAEEQGRARFSIALDRATFLAAFANAQFEYQMIEFETYLARLDAFDIADKQGQVEALTAEADARKELVLSAIDRFDQSAALPALVCWRQVTLSQDLLSTATKLSSEEAQDRKAEMYKSKGDIELLRHRLAVLPKANLSEVVRNSAQTLINNAATYYKGAAQQARVNGDEEVEVLAQQRWALAKAIATALYGANPQNEVEAAVASQAVAAALESCADEGLISPQLAQAIVERAVGSQS